MSQCYLHQDHTLCWTCQWAGGKEGKCPWANKFKPVPGWKAKPTKIFTRDVKGNYIDSFIVYECPLYELMDEIKLQAVENAGKVSSYPDRKTREENYKTVKRMYFEERKIPRVIADLTELDERQIHRIVKKIKERMKMAKRFNLVNVTALVKSILEQDQRARNSDSFLYLRVLKHIESEQREKLNSVTVFDFLLNLQGKVYPCFESVRRARQKVQEKCPELAASEEVQAYRDENEEMFREFARSEV